MIAYVFINTNCLFQQPVCCGLFVLRKQNPALSGQGVGLAPVVANGAEMGRASS